MKGAAYGPHPTVLLVEDDPALATLLVDRLGAKGYCIWHTPSALEADRLLEEAKPDLVILDLMLPDANGLVLCASIKAKAAVPIIVCSATKRREDATLGFQLGADDFIAKPFSAYELLARMEAVLQRTAHPGAEDPPSQDGASPESERRIGEVVINEARCWVMLGGKPLHLTPIEYQILCILASRPDAVLSRKDLAERVWGCYDPAVGRTLDVHIRRLRAKLNCETTSSPRLVTRRGFGYEIVSESQGDRAAAPTA